MPGEKTRSAQLLKNTLDTYFAAIARRDPPGNALASAASFLLRLT